MRTKPRRATTLLVGSVAARTCARRLVGGGGVGPIGQGAQGGFANHGVLLPEGGPNGGKRAGCSGPAEQAQEHGLSAGRGSPAKRQHRSGLFLGVGHTLKSGGHRLLDFQQVVGFAQIES